MTTVKPTGVMSTRLAAIYHVDGKEIYSARASRKHRVFLRPVSGGFVLLGFGDRSDKRLYKTGHEG